MVNFCLYSEVNKELPILKEFIEETNLKLQSSDMAKNPFYGKIKGIEHDAIFYVMVEMTPIWPVTPFVYIGTFSAALILITSGFSLWLAFPLFMFIITGFWTETWLYSMFRLGLRKKGYTGKIRRIGINDLILSKFI